MTAAELSSGNRDYMTHNAENIICLVRKKFADSCFQSFLSVEHKLWENLDYNNIVYLQEK